MLWKRDPQINIEIPAWAIDCDLYRLQIRSARQYAMFVLDASGMLLTWNEGVEAILGYGEREWVGEHFSIIYNKKDRSENVWRREMEIAEEKGVCGDFRWHVRKDGTELFAHGYVSAFRSETGALLGFSKILCDETQSKRTHEALAESNLALEQFAFAASHDLQEPLRTVSGFAQMLNRYYPAGDDAGELVDEIKKGAQRMSALIEDLLDFARLSGKAEENTITYSLDKELEFSLESLAASIEEADAVILREPLPVLTVDQGQITRLFINLIGNALKYRKPDVVPIIQISVKLVAPMWVITVGDNGIGFEPEEAERIFMPFKRLHSHTTIPGTGVGLAICRRIVELHGGRIWAESQPGVGSKFYFTLPVE